jgi:peptide/nickel transport system substrate-binding protein
MDHTQNREPGRGITRRRFLDGALTIAGAAVLPSVVGTASAASASRAPAGELKVSLPARIVALDPLGPQAAEEPVRIVAAHVFDSLVVRDTKTRQYLPSLAAKWESPDPTTWVFTLRPGVKFHDGSPLGARDVKASLERMLKLRGPFAPLWAAVDTVEAPSDSTVRIKTKTPLGTMLANASLLSILPADKVDQAGFFNRPIGSGPFRVASYRPDSELVVEANPSYWGTPPGVQTLRFKDIPEIAARVTALITGEIDLTFALPPDQLAALEKQKGVQIVSTPSYRYYFIWMNIKREPFTDKRVRQAMIYALDLDTMVKTLMQGIARRMSAPIPTTVFGYSPQRPYAYDPRKAKELLAAAGRSSGFDTTMIWNPDSGPQDRELAQALISYWNAIGVRVKDGQAERPQWLDKLLKLDWDMDFQSNGVVTGDADFVLRRLYTASANRMGYASPTVDKLLNDASATVDQNKRKLFYAQANEIIWDDAVGIYPFELVQAYVYRTGVEGFLPTPSFPTFASVTIKR